MPSSRTIRTGAPRRLSSDEINLRLKPTLDRLNIKTDVLKDIDGLAQRAEAAGVQLTLAETTQDALTRLRYQVGAEPIYTAFVAELGRSFTPRAVSRAGTRFR